MLCYIMLCFNIPEVPVTFCATGHFLYTVKTSENLSFSDVSWGYRKRPMARIGLTTVVREYLHVSLHACTTSHIYNIT